MALWTAIFFYVVYPSNELGDQLQETEQRESELASKSHELEKKLLCKIREAAEEVERKVGRGLKCVVCILISLMTACFWPCSFILNAQAHQFNINVHFILGCVV